jgi:primary-amine oxidase
MGSAESELHPFDPLTGSEIESAISLVKKAHGELFVNVVSLHEPRKAEMTKWLESPGSVPKPARIADVVVIAPGGKVYDGLVDLKDGNIIKWELLEGLQPIVSFSCVAPTKIGPELTTS